MKYKQTVKEFKGIVSTGDQTDIPEGGCADQQNVLPTPTGAIATRFGFTKYTTAELTGNVIGLFGYRDKTDTIQILQFTDSGKIIEGTSET